MDALLDRLRMQWDKLSDREKRMTASLGAVLGLLVLGLPLVLIALENASLEDENEALRATLARISEHRVELKQLADARRAAEQRYASPTPPLGSYLETEAKKLGLALFEVTEQPEKSEGSYHRRAIRGAINDVGLTAMVDLLSNIEASPHPVAVDHVEVEHFQSGDKYRLKLGVLTFDRKSGVRKTAAAPAKEGG